MKANESIVFLQFFMKEKTPPLQDRKKRKKRCGVFVIFKKIYEQEKKSQKQRTVLTVFLLFIDVILCK